MSRGNDRQRKESPYMEMSRENDQKRCVYKQQKQLQTHSLTFIR